MDLYRTDFNTIKIDLKRKGAAQHLQNRTISSIDDGIRNIKIIPINPDDHLFPSMCVPVAGMIDKYRSEGINFFGSSAFHYPGYLYRSGILSPKYFLQEDIGKRSFLDCVIKFDSNNIHHVVTGIIESVRQNTQTENGVLIGLELCINEITDNVLIHSLPKSYSQITACGYIMAQIHHNPERIVISVYDNGQGIFQSFSESVYEPKSSIEAIELALKRDVTSGEGQGRGMWMLSSIVESSEGYVEICSDKAKLNVEKKNGSCEPTRKKSLLNTKIDGTTRVDFSINAEKEIDITKALHGYEPTDLWMEDHEDDKSNTIVLKVSEESYGTGSRFSGKHFRNKVINTSKQTNRPVVIDFNDVQLISSSYADELIGKMIEKTGILGFMSRFRLANLNKTNAFILEEALRTRVVQIEKQRSNDNVTNK